MSITQKDSKRQSQTATKTKLLLKKHGCVFQCVKMSTVYHTQFFTLRNDLRIVDFCDFIITIRRLIVE